MSRIAVLLLLVAGISQAQTAMDLQRWTVEAEAGNVNSAFWLGASYQQGKVVPQDFKKAMKWFSWAAAHGNADAQNSMGQMFQDGEGVQVDHVQAAYWFQRACENRPDCGGAGQGCNNLGLLYLSGHGVPQDNVEAYKYFKIGHSPFNVDEVAREMTDAEVADAQRRVEQWRDAHPETK